MLAAYGKYFLEFLPQLNRANQVIGLLDLSTGSTTGTIADPRLIFCAALKGNACGIIVAHNHPSGNLSASQADIALTNKLKEAGKFLEIQLLDHIIITADSYKDGALKAESFSRTLSRLRVI